MQEHTSQNPPAQSNDKRSRDQNVSLNQLPNRLLTVFEVAEFVGCHEESVRRAYTCGQLRHQRFGVRSWRFLPADLQEWIARGAPTRVS